TPLHEIKDGIDALVHLFQPEDAYRMRSGGRGGFGGGDPSAPQYSSAGAVIDYYFADSPGGSVTLEILDAAGDVVRSYTGGDAPARTTTTQGMRAPQMMRFAGSRVDTSPGMHRFVWDLTVAGPEGSNRGGPRVVPGQYQARLTADGVSQTRTFRLLIDPRVAEDGVTQADLQDQFDISMEILALMTEAQGLVAELEGAMERMSGESGQEARRALAELEEIHAALVTDRSISSYPQPMLLDQIQYLYSMLQTADQKPGRDAYERLEVRKREVVELAQRMRAAMRGSGS
ncbi:MAG: hypothetical protein KAJ42_12480, partial [Gemmatimonadetes bacterium]|nr:hypothetical protein [Gemmatimonadota bacterium]